ncbi:hypothetical protein ACKI19_44965, partial [Streptomyces caniscabiei]|uniref:hypothetical protein n=1 Tax=Streptomyces caniscabiei TaxID=2746961 RepID=UPI0038F6681E
MEIRRAWPGDCGDPAGRSRGDGRTDAVPDCGRGWHTYAIPHPGHIPDRDWPLHAVLGTAP